MRAGFERGEELASAAGEHNNAALRMLRSRRFFVQVAAAGAAQLALGGGVLSPVKSPVFAEDAVKDLAGGMKAAPVYDLGIGKDFNRAPGKLIVLPPNVVEQSPSDDKQYRALTLPNGLRYEPPAHALRATVLLLPSVLLHLLLHEHTVSLSLPRSRPVCVHAPRSATASAPGRWQIPRGAARMLMRSGLAAQDVAVQLWVITS